MKQYWNNGKTSGETKSGSAQPRFDEAAQDPEMDAVLKDFRNSVHAWSDATHRSRALVLSPAPHRALGRRSVVWALSVVLAAAGASAGLFEYHQKSLEHRAAIQRQLEHQRLLQQQHALEADELLARVDNDVSREAPSAMEPLANLMADDETQ